MKCQSLFSGINKKNTVCHLLSVGDNLHEMSNPVSGKKRKIFQNVNAENFIQSANHFTLLQGK